jgi:catechol 2,3-dioxygenase-like lactoylglutathione lyase family enzyme
MAAIGRLADVIVDCPDAEALAAFWGELLGRDVVVREDDWVSLAPAHDGGPRLTFQQVRGYAAPQWPSQRAPQQLHLDVRVEELGPAHDRVLALGATVLAEVEDAGGYQWRVYADPAGHPFCLVTGLPEQGD